MSLIIITDHHHLHHHHQPHHPHHCRFWKDDTLALVDQPQRHSALQVLRCSTNNTRYHPRGYHQSIKQLKWWIIQDRLKRAWKDKNLDITPEAAFVRHGWEIIVECRRRRTQRVIFTGWCYIFYISIISISISIVSISINIIIIIFPDDIISTPD